MAGNLFWHIFLTPEVYFAYHCPIPPFHINAIEIDRCDDEVLFVLPVSDVECDDWRFVRVETIFLYFFLHIVHSHVLVVFDKDQRAFNEPTKGEKMIFFVKVDYRDYLFGRNVIILKLFDLVFFVLHPQNALPIVVERHRNLRNVELSWVVDLSFGNIDLVEIFVFDIKFRSWVREKLQRAYFFCVGEAQKMTTLSLYIMVMEWEQTIEEWVRTIFRW